MPLSYPVDTSRSYTYYNTDTNQPLQDGSGRLKINQPWPTSDGFLPSNINPKIKILQEIFETRPVDGVDFDSSTQKIVRANPVVDLDAETYTFGWTIENLTNEEQTSKEEDDRRSTLKRQVANNVTWLRNQADNLEGLPTITNQSQAINQLEGIKTQLIPFLRKFADLIEGHRLD